MSKLREALKLQTDEARLLWWSTLTLAEQIAIKHDLNRLIKDIMKVWNKAMKDPEFMAIVKQIVDDQEALEDEIRKAAPEFGLWIAVIHTSVAGTCLTVHKTLVDAHKWAKVKFLELFPSSKFENTQDVDSYVKWNNVTLDYYHLEPSIPEINYHV